MACFRGDPSFEAERGATPERIEVFRLTGAPGSTVRGVQRLSRKASMVLREQKGEGMKLMGDSELIS